MKNILKYIIISVCFLPLIFSGCKKEEKANPVTCSFTTPVNNDTVLQDYRVVIGVEIASTNSEIILIEVYIDDNLGVSTSENENTSWNWNTTSAAIGLHKIEVKATDLNGNYSNSIIHVFVHKNTITFNPDVTYGSMSDIDGNTYKTVKIGTQTWMAEDLRTTRFASGAKITNYKSAPSAFALQTSNATGTGKWYDWYTVDDYRNLAPTGWHIPTASEWYTLLNYLGGDQIAGSKLLETGNLHWKLPNFTPTNSSGFTALPYDSKGNLGLYWTASENASDYSKALGFYFDNGFPTTNKYPNKSLAFCVRCVKD